MDTDILELMIPLTAIILGSMMFLIPIAGLTARFALRPIMEAIAKGRELQMQGTDQSREVAILEQRVALLEQQLQGIESSLHRIEDGISFERQLRPGGGES